MQRRTLLTAVALIGVGVVFGIVLTTGWGSSAIQRAFASGNELGASTAPVQTPEVVKALNNQFVAVSEAVKRSVVSINITVERKRTRSPLPNDLFRFFGPDGEDLEMPEGLDESEGGGSGVIVTKDGYIVTNNHVVENAKEGGIKVTTHDQKEHKATLVGRDPLTDLAVLKITGEHSPAHFAERSDVRVGEWVVAVGNPLGLKSTVTTGIVSAMGRGIGIVGTNDRTFERNRYAVENFIQTDAAINPGNSGGGLFNLGGSLVGINTAIASRNGYNQGYGFAIPIDMVKSVALDLMDDGKIQRGYIGVEISSIDETSAKAVALSTVAGVQVQRVVKDGAAAAAGLEVGDVILKIDGEPVKTSNDLQNEIVLRRAGDKVNLTIWRNKQEIVKTVRLKSLEGNDSFADATSITGENPTPSYAAPVNFKGLGFTAQGLSENQMSEFDTKSGVVVSKVEGRGPVARRGLRPNTVILKADGQAINSPSQLSKILSSKKAGDGVMFVVKDKDGTKQAVTVEIPEDNS